jgi:hypothetical protein
MYVSDPLRDLLVELFDQFLASPIEPAEQLSVDRRMGGGDEIENYFRGRRWPDLIPYFKRWDQSLSTLHLTPAGFKAALPAYLFAALLWTEVLETGVLMRILLAPALTEPEHRKGFFMDVHASLSPAQRGVVGRVLKYLLQSDPGYPESYTSLTRREMYMAIERLWERKGEEGTLAKETTRPDRT